VKSFEEIMREKQQKRASQLNTSKDLEKSVTTESKQPGAVANKLTDVQKSKRSSPKKYKFTPVVFDLDNKRNEKANAGSMTEQTKQKSLESVDNSGSTSVQVRRQVSTSKAAPDGSIAVTDISVTVQQSVPLKLDLTTEVEATATESPSDKSERRITPVIKRQSSSSNPPSDVTKKRRTSVDSRWRFLILLAKIA